MTSGGDTFHESVEELLTERTDDAETASDVITRKAREVIAKHRRLWKGPPFCPFELADLEGIIVEEAPCDIKSDGRIFPKGKQVYIQYAKGQCRERVHFTICHELAHTLFPDCYKRVRNRSASERAEWEFENLCNIAAAEFLFPLPEFEEDLGGVRISANRLIELANGYGASIDATSRRAVMLTEFPACVVFARFEEPTGGKRTSLVVRYAVSNAMFPLKIYPNLRINSKSVANAAYAEQKAASSPQENWMVGGKWARFRVEAAPLPKFESKETSDLAILLYS